MAKVKVTFGKMRGKMGGLVFRGGDNGETIVSEYNGAPRNPRTMLQTEQRSKMNLAGLMSKMTPYLAIAGLNSSRRRARSMFTSNIVKNTSSVASAGGATQTLAAAALKLSKGRVMPTHVDASAWSQDQTINLQVYNDSASDNLLFARVVVYFSQNGRYVSCVIADTESINPNTSKLVSIGVPVSIQETGGEMNVYVIPVVDDNTDARALYQNYIADPSESDDYQVSFTRSLVSLGVFCESNYAGNYALTV